MFAEIFFVKRESRLAVEFMQHISVRTGDEPFGSEGVPAAKRTKTDFEPAAVETKANHAVALRLVVAKDERLTKARSVTRHAAGYRYVLRQMSGQRLDEVAAVDFQAVGKNQHV